MRVLLKSLFIIAGCLTASSFPSKNLAEFSTKDKSCFQINTIAVFGGTGKTGSEVVYQALKTGQKVVVLARNPEKMLIPKGSGGSSADQLLKDPNLSVIKGSVTDADSVEMLFESNKDINGVVIALGIIYIYIYIYIYI